ncbi:serine/threonine-protein kinase/endoribonuclease IRE1-like [Schistocerca gregaria]|uniref:serine/threonine-protein kinase/endoribonuclease IRE1-like n=1 Tax=Schistocerca gregaria TaxID=7010 RepID=UPI00211ED445|nr:serine/threonine-protein kinase/endoribonuclease IRE1-like [Schistocerca gregaria]
MKCYFYLIVLHLIFYGLIGSNIALVNHGISGTPFYAVRSIAASAEPYTVNQKNMLSPWSPEHIVVGCLDGSIRGIEIFTGAELWSFESNNPLLKSSLSSFVPSVKGHVYHYQEDRLKQCVSSIPKFVSKLPILREDGILFLGYKEDSFYSIDSVSAIANQETNTLDGQQCEAVDLLDRLVVMRTDYRVMAVDSLTGQQYWNISYGEFVPSSMPVYEVLKEDEKELAIHVVVSFIDGNLELVNSISGKVLWNVKLPSPAIQVLGPQYLPIAGIYLKSLELVWKVPQLLLNHTLSQDSVLVFDHQGVSVALDGPTNLWPLSDTPNSLPGITDNLSTFDIYSELRNLYLISDTYRIEELPSYSELLTISSDGGSNTTQTVDHCVPQTLDIQLQDFAFFSFRTSLLFGTLLFLVVLCLVIVCLHKSRKHSHYLVKSVQVSTELSHHTRERVNSDGILHIGRLYINTNNILGYGSSGTIVYEGQLDNRKIAVKRMLRSHYFIAEKETSILIESDDHPNVVRYFMTEQDREFIYLALSYAEYSLETFVESEKWIELMPEDMRDILFQLTNGLHHLHQMNIIHRDIKPQNALVDSNLVVKISDMGLARKLDTNRQSHSTTIQATLGWRSPELILELGETYGELSANDVGGLSKQRDFDDPNTCLLIDRRVKVTKKADIFNLGCLFYYVMTRRHPFGDNPFREFNILFKRPTLSESSFPVPELFDLISKMISKSPDDRPTTDQILKHPYFWSKRKRLHFLTDASDFLEFEKPFTRLVQDFEKACVDAAVIPDDGWVLSLSQELHAELKKFRKYDVTKVRDLLRVIRNKSYHYRELSDELKKEFGTWPDGFLDYFCKSRFPKLLIVTWEFARTRCRYSREFKRYFKNEPIDENPLPQQELTQLCSELYTGVDSILPDQGPDYIHTKNDSCQSSPSILRKSSSQLRASDFLTTTKHSSPRHSKRKKDDIVYKSHRPEQAESDHCYPPGIPVPL